MFGELLRRLTADYTEEERREYLEETTFNYLSDIPKGENDFHLPEVTGKERNKEIAGLLSDVAEETGYEEVFLWERFSDVVRDLVELGETFTNARKEAFIDVATISYEQDW